MSMTFKPINFVVTSNKIVFVVCLTLCLLLLDYNHVA